MSSALFLIYILIFLCGLSFGSFLNVLVYRLPEKISLISPPSSCTECGCRIKPLDLIPVVSYIFLRGKCRHCKTSISWRYPVVEFVCGLLFLILFWYFGFNMKALFYLTLLYLLLAVALIDLNYWIIPNGLVTWGLILGSIMQLPLLLSRWLFIPSYLLTDRPIVDSLLGFLAGGAILLLVFLVSRGGMGAGDVKLMALIGFYVGLSGVAVVLMLAFLTGALVGLAFIISGKLSRKDALPFGPYLAFATLIEVFWGESVWFWYIHLL